MTEVVMGPGGELKFSDLLAWLKGMANPLSRVIITASKDKGFQAHLALWVYRPLLQIVENYSRPCYDLIPIPEWLFE